jgi:hypothetical protein
MRIDFQLKLILLRRSRRSPLRLIRAQRIALGPTLTALESASADDVDDLELWRRQSATAAADYLEHLERNYSTG